MGAHRFSCSVRAGSRNVYYVFMYLFGATGPSSRALAFLAGAVWEKKQPAGTASPPKLMSSPPGVTHVHSPDKSVPPRRVASAFNHVPHGAAHSPHAEGA